MSAPFRQAHQIEPDPSPRELLLGGLVGFAVLLLLCIVLPGVPA